MCVLRAAGLDGRFFMSVGNHEVWADPKVEGMLTALPYLKKFGVTFPILLDDPKTYSTSNAYGLTNVPTSFWISSDGMIEISSVGWMRTEFEEMASRAAAATASVPLPIFQPKEAIADFRAG